MLKKNYLNSQIAVKRPNLGCRTLVSREVLKLLPVIIRELDDWVSI